MDKNKPNGSYITEDLAEFLNDTFLDKEELIKKLLAYAEESANTFTHVRKDFPRSEIVKFQEGKHAAFCQVIELILTGAFDPVDMESFELCCGEEA
jgi:hypothetical protein